MCELIGLMKTGVYCVSPTLLGDIVLGTNVHLSLCHQSCPCRNFAMHDGILIKRGSRIPLLNLMCRTQLSAMSSLVGREDTSFCIKNILLYGFGTTELGHYLLPLWASLYYKALVLESSLLV